MAKSKDVKGHQDYHHGDLKRALVSEAMKIVSEEGVEALSLRELARRVGVSHAAPYRHFPDKKALLKEMAEEGFRELLQTMMEAGSKPASDALARFQEVGWAYVKFALAHPERVNLMFGPETSPRENDNCALEPAEATFDFVTQALDAAKKEGAVVEGETVMQAVASWALVHGLSILLINGRLQKKELDKLSPETLSKTVTGILMQGLRRK